MKQSQSAITFLMAQYRSVYGRAYVKGLASVVVAASALAPSVADAAYASGAATWDEAANKEDIKLESGSSYFTLTTQRFFNNVSVDSGANFTISRGADQNTAAVVRGTATVQNGAVLNVGERGGQNGRLDGALASWNVANGMTNTQGATGDLDNYGTVNIGFDDATGTVQMNTVTLRSGSTTNITSDPTKSGYISENSLLEAGLGSSGGFTTEAGSTLNLNDFSTVRVASGEAKIGGTVNLNAQAAGSSAVVLGLDGSTITFDSGSQINVKASSGTNAIYAPNINLNGTLNVETGAAVQLNGAVQNQDALASNSRHGANTITVGNGGVVNIDRNGRVIVGGRHNNNTTSTIEFQEGSQLTGKGALDVRGTLKLTEGVLDQFTGHGTNTANNGTIILRNANLEFSDTNQVDLTDTTIGTTAASDIRFLGTNNTIASQSLKVGGSMNTAGADLNINLKSQDLEFDGSQGSGKIGYQSATAQNVTFTSATDSAYVLEDGVTLHAHATKNGIDNTSTASGGTSTGNVIITSGPDNAYKVQAGAYTHTGDMTLSGGNVVIGGSTTASDPAASLAVSGNFTLDNNGSNVIDIKNNGNGTQGSVLDLTGANVQVIAGTGSTNINVGDNSSSSSQLKINNTGFNAIAEATSTSINLYGQSELNVVGSGDPAAPTVTSIDVSKLGTQSGQGVAFVGGGTMRVDDTLQLKGNSSNNTLDIGSGTIAANALDFSTASGNTDTINLNAGNFEVVSALSATDGSVKTVNVGSNNGTTNVKLSTADAADTGTIDPALALQGANTTLDVSQGTWTAHGDISAQNGSTINVGSATTSATLDGTTLNLGSGANFNIVANTDPAAATNAPNNAAFNNVSTKDGGTINLDRGTYLTVTEGDFTGGKLQGSGIVDIRGDVDAGTQGHAQIASGVLEGFVGGSNVGHINLDNSRLNISGGNVDLGNYTFSTNTDPLAAGTTNGDFNLQSESTIASDALTVGNTLTDGNGADLSTVLNVEAKNLTLGGGNGFTSAQSNLGYKSATATESVTFKADAGTNADMTLKDNVVIDAAGNSNGGTATSTGNVILAGNVDLGAGGDPTQNKVYQVRTGDVSHTGNMTLQNGTLVIGGADSTANPEAAGTNASLVFGNTQNPSINKYTLTFDNRGEGTDNRIYVIGNGKDANLGAEAQAGTSTLDLTNAKLDVQRGSGNTVISVGSLPVDQATADSGVYEAQVKVTKDQLDASLFKPNGSTVTPTGNGLTFELAGNSLLEVSGVNSADTPLELDFSNLGSSDGTTDLDSDKIYFNQGGTLKVDHLALKNNNFADSGVNIGSGTIETETLTVDDNYPSDQINPPDSVVIQGGNFKIASNLDSTANNTIILGDGSGTVNVSLGDFTVNESNNLVSAYTEVGKIGANLQMSGDSTLNIDSGKWQIVPDSASNALGDLQASGAGTTINIGTLDDMGNAYRLEHNHERMTAILEGQNLSLQESRLNIRDGSSAKFDSLTSNGANIFINGTDGGNTRMDIASQVDIQGGSIKVNGIGSNIAFSEQAADQISIDANGTDLIANGFDSVFELTNDATLRLEFGSDTNISKTQIEALRQALIKDNKGEILTDGFISVGGAHTDAIIYKLDENGKWVIDYEANKAILADIKDIVFDKNQDATLGKIDPTTPIYVGKIGNGEVLSDSQNFKAGDVIFTNAKELDDGNKYFFTNESGDTTVGAIIVDGGRLGLENGGHVGGDITFEGSGDFYILADDSVEGGEDTTTYLKNVSGGNVEANMRVNGVTEVKENIVIGNLTVNKDLTVGTGANDPANPSDFGNVTVNNKLTGAANLVGSGDLTVKQDTNYSGNLQFAGNGNFSGSTTLRGDNNTFGGDVVIGNNNSSTNIFTTGSKLSATNGTFTGTTNVAGELNLTDKAGFDGITTFLSGSTLNAANADFNNTTKIDGALNVTDTITFSGNTTQYQNGVITAGTGSFSGNTSLYGQSTFTSGDVTFDSTTSASDKTGLASGSSITASNSAVIFKGQTQQDAGSTITAASGNFSGTSVLNGQVDILGQADFTGNTQQGTTGVLNVDVGNFTGTTELNGQSTFTSVNFGNTSSTDQNTDNKFYTGSQISATTGNFYGKTTQYYGSTLDIETATFQGETKLGGTSNFGTVTFNQGTTLAGTTNVTGHTTINGGSDVASNTGVVLDGNNIFNTADIKGKTSFVGNNSFSGAVVVTEGNLNLKTGSSTTFADVTVTGDTVQETGSQLNVESGSFTGNTKLAGVSNIANSTFTGATELGGYSNLSGSVAFTTGQGNTTDSIKLTGTTAINSGADVTFNGNTEQSEGSYLASTDSKVTFNGHATLKGTTTLDEVVFNRDLNSNEAAFISGEFRANSVSIGSSGGNNVTATGGELHFVGTHTAHIENLIANNTNSLIQVGADGAATSNAGTGALEVTNLALNGGTLYADPEYGQQTAIVAINNGVVTTGGGAGATPTDVGVIDGNIVVGKNAAVGLGSNVSGVRAAIAQYQNGNSLPNDGTGPGSVLYLAESTTVADGNYIVVNSDQSNSTLESTQTLINMPDGRQADLALSDHSALMIHQNAFNDGAGNAATALTFEKSNALVYSTGGEIILTGNYNFRDSLQIFDDAGNDGVEVAGQAIKVSSTSGIFKGTIETGQNQGDVILALDEQEVRNSGKISNPIKDFIPKYVADTANQNSYVDYAMEEDLSALDKTARLGAFGGAAHTALAASNATQEAIARRTGMGFGGAGGQDFVKNKRGGMWASPIYQRTDSDGFDSQGINYGTDVDLYGVAVGAELAFNPNLRAGVVLNVGTGDAEGNDAASGVSNDFDYYGFGAYVSMRHKNLEILGDVSYTNVSNDLTASSSSQLVGTTNASTDSNALSLGATAKLNFFTNGTKISPYAGLRYTRLEMDDYGVGSQYGEVGRYSSSSMDIFSLPVGVNIASEWKTRNGWFLKPAIDLKVQANFGDDSSHGSMAWSNTNLATDLSTTVLDDFIYGVNLGFSAQKDNFNFGIGINYQGSENTENYGIQANASLLF